MKGPKGFAIRPFPKRRRLVTDIGWMSRSRHSMRGMLEVDITDARSLIRKWRRRTGKPLSLTAFLVSTVAQAIARNPEVNASHARGGRIAYFEAVNILAMVEVTNTDGMRIPIGHLIGGADKLDAQQIESVIDRFRAGYNDARATKLLDVVTTIPRPLRRLLFARMPLNPKFIQETMGTAVVSAVGMFLPRHAAWALGQSNHTVSVWVGSTLERPCMVNGVVTPRTMACITIDIDHDIIDGAPAARFTAMLVEMIEKATVLEGERAAPS
jgi:pyruvate/2-oxoglutarate dehydrogenase complex dihydrolipoamide acyltransferase (E2) component